MAAPLSSKTVTISCICFVFCSLLVLAPFGAADDSIIQTDDQTPENNKQTKGDDLAATTEHIDDGYIVQNPKPYDDIIETRHHDDNPPSRAKYTDELTAASANEQFITEQTVDAGGGTDENDKTTQEKTEDEKAGEEKTEQDETASSEWFTLQSLFENIFEPVFMDFSEDLGSESEEDVNEDANVSMSAVVPTMTQPASADNATKTVNETLTPVKKSKFHCVGKNLTNVNDTAAVRIVNSTELLRMLSFNKTHIGSECALVMFFAPWCQFCSQVAPHYNALGRAFPQLDVLAVDAVHFSSLNARFGTVSVPNIMLFHQSRAVSRYNQSVKNFEYFVSFIKNITGLQPNTSVDLIDGDYIGPLSSAPTEETDYLLWLSWIFVVVCSIYMLTVSSLGQTMINRVCVLWQEHQHID